MAIFSFAAPAAPVRARSKARLEQATSSNSFCSAVVRIHHASLSQTAVFRLQYRYARSSSFVHQVSYGLGLQLFNRLIAGESYRHGIDACHCKRARSYDLLQQSYLTQYPIHRSSHSNQSTANAPARVQRFQFLGSALAKGEIDRCTHRRHGYTHACLYAVAFSPVPCINNGQDIGKG